MKDICLIVNPISGGKDKSGILAAVEKHLDGSLYRLRVEFTERPGQAEEMARGVKADVVVAVGGDGTVSEVARGLIGSEKTLGIIPCGSGDGLALHLGISRSPGKAVKTLNEACETRIDAATLDGNFFFCTAGMGLDAAVSLEFARSTTRGSREPRRTRTSTAAQIASISPARPGFPGRSRPQEATSMPVTTISR